MNEKILPFLCGLVVGVGGALIVMLAGGSESEDPDDLQLSKLREEKTSLEKTLRSIKLTNEELEEKLLAAEAERLKAAERRPVEATPTAPERVEPAPEPTGIYGFLEAR